MRIICSAGVLLWYSSAMLRHPAIHTVLALGCAYSAWSQVPMEGSKQNRPTQKEADKVQPVHPSPPILQVQLGRAKPENDAQQTASSYPWKELVAPANIPNWVLCFVGCFAGWAAFKTLRSIKRQADLMNRNNTVALTSARAALASARTANEQISMMKNQERARIAVTIYPIEAIDLDSNGENSVRMQVENLGPTHAHNVRSSATARVVVKGFDRWDVDDLDDLMLPKVIRSDVPPVDTDLPFIFLDEWLEEILEWKFKLIIELRGVITYEDVFGEKHSTAFSYDMKIDKASPLPRGDLWEVKSYFGWHPTHGEGDNNAT